jgi:hypothetical protein
MKRDLFTTVAIFFLATVVFVTSCKVQKPYEYSGVALCTQMIKAPGSNVFVRMNFIKHTKIYFNDSSVIEERPALPVCLIHLEKRQLMNL